MCCNCYFSGYKFIIFPSPLFRSGLSSLSHARSTGPGNAQAERARNVYDNLANPSIICSFAFRGDEHVRRAAKENPRLQKFIFVLRGERVLEGGRRL